MCHVIVRWLFLMPCLQRRGSVGMEFLVAAAPVSGGWCRWVWIDAQQRLLHCVHRDLFESCCGAYTHRVPHTYIQTGKCRPVL